MLYCYITLGIMGIKLNPVSVYLSAGHTTGIGRHGGEDVPGAAGVRQGQAPAHPGQGAAPEGTQVVFQICCQGSQMLKRISLLQVHHPKIQVKARDGRGEGEDCQAAGGPKQGTN